MSVVDFLPKSKDDVPKSTALAQFEGQSRTRKDIERVFSRFDLTPEQWLAAATDYFQLNMSITQDQVSGLDRSLFAAQDQVLEYDTATSGSYVDLAHTGPQFLGVGSGTFELIFGAIYDSGAGGDGYMAFSVNGSSPSDSEGAFAWMSGAARVNVMRGVQLVLTEPKNDIVAKYRVLSGTNGFLFRWATLKRVGS